MREILFKLLLQLEEIANRHEEATDTVCRDAMRAAVFNSFLRPKPGYELPDDFGLLDPDANIEVKTAIAEFVRVANDLATSFGLKNFHQRLAAFQDVSVVTDGGTTYDEFFGYQIARMYAADGTWLGPE